MNNGNRPLENRVRKEEKTLTGAIKMALHVVIPIEGQRYYSRHTELPKPLAIGLVTTLQMGMYVTPALVAYEQLAKYI